MECEVRVHTYCDIIRTHLEMSVFVAFGQVVNELPTLTNDNLLTWQQGSSWAIVLKETVRDIGPGIYPIGVSTLVASHGNYLQDFVNALVAEGLTLAIAPDWIIINDACATLF